MYLVIKRCFDVLFALTILPVAIVICVPLAIVFTLTTGERPVFRQWRTGLNRQPFRIWKLRTMTEARDEKGALLPDADRLTLMGRLMRKFSIDEVPQIINILKGEMSFVGPRPQVDVFLNAMTDKEKHRYDVFPGITGWAQINGRNATNWSERFVQDLWYVKNASFLLDMSILVRTPFAILKANGVAQDGHVTMPTLFEERSQQQVKG